MKLHLALAIIAIIAIVASASAQSLAPLTQAHQTATTALTTQRAAELTRHRQPYLAALVATASRPTFGVRASLFPKHEKSPRPTSSIRTSIMFGRSAAEAEPQSSATSVRNFRTVSMERSFMIFG